MTDKDQKKKPAETVIPVTDADDDSQDDRQIQETPEAEGGEKETEYVKQLQRLQAEFQNYKRRVEKDWAEVSSGAKGDFVVKLLPALDDFKRLLNHHRDQEPCPTGGVRLIYQKLIKILTDEGLEYIDAVGEEFNPDFHEAIGVKETGEEQEGKIVEEWEAGYTFSGKLIRPSRVRVGKCSIKTDE